MTACAIEARTIRRSRDRGSSSSWSSRTTHPISTRPRRCDRLARRERPSACRSSAGCSSGWSISATRPEKRSVGFRLRARAAERREIRLDGFTAIGACPVRAVLEDEPARSGRGRRAERTLREKTQRDEELAELLSSQIDAGSPRGDVQAELRFQVRPRGNLRGRGSTIARAPSRRIRACSEGATPGTALRSSAWRGSRRAKASSSRRRTEGPQTSSLATTPGPAPRPCGSPALARRRRGAARLTRRRRRRKRSSAASSRTSATRRARAVSGCASSTRRRASLETSSARVSSRATRSSRPAPTLPRSPLRQAAQIQADFRSR